jgi:SAM-dependent methyltransferase
MPISAAGGDSHLEMVLFARGGQIAAMLGAAASLGIADHIDDKPRPVAELAVECGALPDRLARLCRAMAAFGIFSVDADDRVSHTPHSRHLRSDANPTIHHALRYWTMPSAWEATGNLTHAVRTGESAFEARLGMPFFDYLRAHPEEGAVFDSFMQNSPDDRHAAVAEAYDLSDAKLVVDIGGGNGALLAALLRANANLRGILFDQEEVAANAWTMLGNLGMRSEVEVGSFFEAVPAGGDVYTMSQIMHDWNDEGCLRILANIREAIEPGGRLLVIERDLDSSRGRANPLNFLSDLHIMTLFSGARERTPAEFARLFRQSGFGEPRIVPTRTPFAIVETRAVD